MKKIVVILLLFSNNSYSQNFLNGSFENNSAHTCFFNISNSIFDSLFPFIKGIGNLQGLDVLFNDSCSQSYGLAQNGSYNITLDIGTITSISTGISLELSDSLIQGNSYTFCYYDRITSLYPGDTIEIGMAANNNSFGTIIYSSPLPISQLWSRRLVTFTAPITSKYITARAKIGVSNRWVLIDNFNFDTTNVVNEILGNANEVIVYPNPSKGIFTFKVNDEVKEIEIRDLLGDEILSSTKREIDLSSYANGIYFYKVKTKEGKVFNGKLVKQ